jgi:hypothetical protein
MKFNVGDKVKINTSDRWNERVGIVKEVYNHSAAYSVWFDTNETAGFEERELELIEELKKEFGKFAHIGLEIGQFTDDKNKQYGSSVDATYEIFKVLMERYTYDEENYLMPKNLLQHLLLQVRMMDKVNRIINNPSGKGDSESPYKDLTGYSLIGVEMVGRNKGIK